MYGDGTDAFESWLNSQSTAIVDSYANAKPTLAPAFLAQYDVVILQWLRDVPDGGGDGPLWQFSQAEVNALADWVNSGGGLVALSGYDGDGQEVVPLNALLSFTGFVYNMDGTYGSTCTGGSCWGGACALTAWNTAAPIGAHLMQVGIQNGRSISVAADAGYAPVVARQRLSSASVLVQRTSLRVSVCPLRIFPPQPRRHSTVNWTRGEAAPPAKVADPAHAVIDFAAHSKNRLKPRELGSRERRSIAGDRGRVVGVRRRAL